MIKRNIIFTLRKMINSWDYFHVKNCFSFLNNNGFDAPLV